MLVLDTFSYNGEPIVKLRLQTLYNHVDTFIIVESWYTHAGDKKPFLYFEEHKDVFAPYMDKIKFLLIDKFPEPTDEWMTNTRRGYVQPCSSEAWFRENYQRDYAVNYIISNIEGPYIVFVCDVDEIPFKSTIGIAKGAHHHMSKPCYLEMEMFYYDFRWKKPYKWYMSFVVNETSIKGASVSDMRTITSKDLVIRTAGCHCSYFFDVDGIIRKLKSFAHREFGSGGYLDQDKIKRCLEDGTDLFSRGDVENCQNCPTVTLPGNMNARNDLVELHTIWSNNH